jgi:hypothetical protein
MMNATAARKKTRRNDGREQARLFGRCVNEFDIRLRDLNDMAYVQRPILKRASDSIGLSPPCLSELRVVLVGFALV